MLLIKYENDVMHITICLASGMTVEDVIVWYQSLFSTLSLDGMDKWSLDQGFEKEIVSGGLISDLRMFLSVNGLLDHVAKLRRCSGIIKL